MKYWQRPFNIVSPSTWVANCARSSVLMANWPVDVVPNPIDIILRPINKYLARQLLDLLRFPVALVWGYVRAATTLVRESIFLLLFLNYEIIQP